jgi:hypothetical protein
MREEDEDLGWGLRGPATRRFVESELVRFMAALADEYARLEGARSILQLAECVRRVKEIAHPALRALTRHHELKFRSKAEERALCIVDTSLDEWLSIKDPALRSHRLRQVRSQVIEPCSAHFTSLRRHIERRMAQEGSGAG